MNKAVKFHEHILTEVALIPGVKQVRGAGLLIGIELEKPNANEIAQAMILAGVLVNAANASTIRIAPALIVTQVQIDKFIATFRKVLTDGN